MNPDDEIELLNEIIDEILRGMQETIQSGEILSDEFQGVIAEAITYATDRIDELRTQQAEQPTPPEEPPPAIPTQPAPPEGADLLWILAGGQPAAFVNYLRTVPDQAMNALATNPEQLRAAIENLSRRFPEGIHLQADGIQHAPLMSSNVYGYRYDRNSGRLLVRFNSGSVYQYDGVPPGIFDIFRMGAVPAKTDGENRWGRWWQGKQPSLGAAFHEMIRRGGYPYRRVS